MALRASAGADEAAVDVAATGFFADGLALGLGVVFFAVVFFAAKAGEALSNERTAEAARKSRRFNRLSGMRWIVRVCRANPLAKTTEPCH